MANKRETSKGSTKKNPAQNVRWANISLPDDAVPDIERLLETPGDLFADLLSFVAGGGTVGLKRSSDGEGFMAYAILPAADDDSVHIGISGYADEPVAAVASLVYKVLVCVGGQPTTDHATKRGGIR